MKRFEIIKQNKWILLILLLATFLRFYHLNFQSLWMDEIYTMNVASPKLSWSEFHKQLIKREGFPYFYFLLVKLFYYFFGYTGVVARALSAMAGIACVYAIYKLAKELNNKTIGIYAALLLTVNEYQIYISQDARPYSLYFLFTVISFHRLVIFLKNRSLKNGIFYGFAIGLLLNINFFSFINVFSQVVILLIFILLVPKTEKWALIKNAAISGIIALLLFAPNYLILKKLLNYKAFWVKPPAPDSFSAIFKNFFGNFEITAFIIIILFIFYFIKVFQKQESKQLTSDKIFANKMLFNFIILFTWFFVFFSFLMIKSYGKISYLLTRYFISITPVLFIVLSISIYSIKGKITKGIVLFTLIFFTLTNLFVVKKYYTTHSQTQFRELSFYVMEHNKSNEKVYTEYKYWYDYYFFKKNKKTINITFEKLMIQMQKNPAKAKSFWYIGLFKKPFKPSEKTKKYLEKNFKNDSNFDGYQVWAKHFQKIKQ
jgi:4-amino-4-deoxy-L-arabinose transferase-like glycosyltransferase